MTMRVFIVSGQVRGLYGTGGLGDVAAALAKAVATRGDVEVRVVMLASANLTDGCNCIPVELEVPLSGRAIRMKVYETYVPTSSPDEPLVRCHLLRPPSELGIVEHDSAEEGILLSRGSVELARSLPSFRPDVIHSNDWHAGLVAVYRDVVYADDADIGKVGVVFTTHNLGPAYQGAFSRPTHIAWMAGLDRRGVLTPGTTRSVEHFDRFNFAKAGLGFSDLINTVSSTHAREIHLPAFAGGLHGVIRERDADVSGIVNGLDIHEWNASCDDRLKDYKFSSSDSLEGIAAAKRGIRRLLRGHTAPDGTRPFASVSQTTDDCLVGIVSRIDRQKVPIIMAAMHRLLAINEIQIVILGDHHPKDDYGRFQADLLHRTAAESGGRLMFCQAWDIDLSHLVFAASDMKLVASCWEPCGLTQLIGLRYGSVPVVRACGGLADTVVDDSAGEHANGFTFKEPLIDESETADVPKAATLLISTMRRAVTVWSKNRERWFELIHNGMTRDSSWNKPAAAYVRLYHEARRRRIPHVPVG